MGRVLAGVLVDIITNDGWTYERALTYVRGEAKRYDCTAELDSALDKWRTFINF